MHPDFPILEGYQQLRDDWSINLPIQFNRRVDDGSLVFWRSGITVWVNAYGNNNHEKIGDRLQWIRNETSASAKNINIQENATLTKYTYRLEEKRGDHSIFALYSYAISLKGHIQIAIYLDAEQDFQVAQQISSSISHDCTN